MATHKPLAGGANSPLPARHTWKCFMYVYDTVDQQLVDQRVAQFSGQTERFLNGQLTEDEFRVLRLQNGLYIQRHAPMLRKAIPAAQPSLSMKSGVIGNSPTRPRIPSVPKYFFVISAPSFLFG